MSQNATLAGRGWVLQNALMRFPSSLLTSSLLLITTMWVASARASLGSGAESILTDAEELQGVLQPSLHQHFQVQEIISENGMLVREFLSRGGLVFAVSWQGPAMPDLKQLLGAQYPAYAAAIEAQKRPGLQRSVRVATPDLVVESEGHLRAFVGRSYLPGLVPAGVSVDELR